CAAKDFSADDPRVSRLASDREAVWWAWFTNDTTKLHQLLADQVVASNMGDWTWQDRSGVLAGAQEFVKSGGKLVRVTFPKTVQRGRATEMFIWRNGVWQNSGWHLDSGS